MRTWGGRRAQRLVVATLTSKGRVCHLCNLGGANSADHEPPRSALVRAGIQDPDAQRFLYPAHLDCNIRRSDRPLTDDLRAELRAAKLRSVRVNPGLSSRFAARLEARP